MQVAKESYAVLRDNPSLAIFPVLSGLATLAVSIPFLVVLVGAAMAMKQSQHAFGAVHYALTAAMYFVNYFVVVFFNSALVACASENLQGRPVTVKFGFQAAVSRLPQILGWALVASTVGMVLKTIGERTGVIGSIVTSVIGLVWNLAVFFVVPCLVLDREGPIAAVKTSTGMIKKTWGERLILGFGITTIMGLLFVVAAAPIVIAVGLAIAEMYVLAAICAVVGLLSILTLAIIGSAMNTIFQTALYLYSRNGAVPAAFAPASLQGAFAPRPERKLFGR